MMLPSMEIVAMTDAFEDRLNGSLKKQPERSKKINVKEKHRYVGFDAYKKAIDQVARHS